MPHSQQRVRAYLRLLRRCDAPPEVLADFVDIVEIDNGIEGERGDLEALDRLLLNVCVRHNFPRPFDQPGKRASFRPMLVGASDCAGTHDEFDPIAEQAYRRGYTHGFARARALIEGGRPTHVQAAQAELQRWRTTKVIFGPTCPPHIEPYGIKVSIRTSLSAKLRFQILERDHRRCVICGASAKDGATLHVDHIISVYNGGSDDQENLQTLCEPCNLGKGKN
jgi:hypothetical protein